MSPARASRIASFLLALGLAASLAATGEAPWFTLGILLPSLFAGLFREAWVARSQGVLRWVVRVGSVVALVLFAADALARWQLLHASLLVTVFAQAFLALRPASPEESWRMQLLAFFQMVALAASTTRVFFSLAFLFYLVLGPAALVLLGAARARGRRVEVPGEGGIRPLLLSSVRVSIVAGLLAMPLFVVLPRYEAGYLSNLRRRNEDLSGFSEEVRLGAINRIKLNTQVVMRVKLAGRLPRDLRYRGVALDRYDGRSWSRAGARKELVPGRRGVFPLASPPPRSGQVVQEILLEANPSLVVFHVAPAVRLETDEIEPLRDEEGNLYRQDPARRRLHYRVVSATRPLGGTLTGEERRRNLELPELDPRIAAIGRGLARGASSPREIATRIREHLASTYRYSLDVRDEGVERPLERFLLDKAPGHCEYFATAMAALLRAEGIPARVVTGFLPGSYTRITRSWTVRQSDAHSWAEGWIDGEGWVTFDATPAEEIAGGGALRAASDAWYTVQVFWDDYIVGYNVTFQENLYWALRDALGVWRARAGALVERIAGSVGLGAALVGVLVAAAGSWWLLRRGSRLRSREPEGDATRLWRRVERALRRQGLRRAPGSTPEEFAREAGRRLPGARATLLELTAAYQKARFDPGAGGVRRETREVAARTIAALRSAARAPARGGDGA